MLGRLKDMGGDVMSEGANPLKKMIPIIVITWILSLVTTLAIVYIAPSIFPIQTAHVTDEAITTEKMADSAIITTKLADGTVTSAKILDGTLTAVDMADGSITTVKVADGAVTIDKIANDSVTSEKIADGNVTTADLADDAVTTSKIVEEAIVTVKLADGSVTSAKILDGTIITADLATGAVTSVKIANGAVTTNKIADYAVTNLKLAANAIPYNFTYTTASTTKTTTITEDIPGMSVEITLERNSTLLIMFSTEARISPATANAYWRARVNTTYARPGMVILQPSTTGQYSSISYNFYQEGLTPGKYTVYMQWSVSIGATATVYYRTFTVMAFPA